MVVVEGLCNMAKPVMVMCDKIKEKIQKKENIEDKYKGNNTINGCQWHTTKAKA